MQTLNASTSWLIPKRNRLKFLTLHLPFWLLVRKNTQTEWPSWVLWNLLLLMKQSNVLQNDSRYPKNAKSRVDLSQLCNLCTTHSSGLKCNHHDWYIIGWNSDSFHKLGRSMATEKSKSCRIKCEHTLLLHILPKHILLITKQMPI